MQDSGGTTVCWQKTRKSMWSAFFGNCGGAVAGKLAVSTRLTLLNLAVLPILHHRDTRWPVSTQRSMDIDTLQHKMVASIQRVQKIHGEDPESFMRRRNRAATAQIELSGAWRTQHCRRVLAWDAHCRRPANSKTWAAKLLDFHGERWLNERRAECQRDAQSRLDSRICRGAPAARWHDGVKYAKSILF